MHPRGGPLVSLLAPAHSAGREKREDRIRFKNIVNRAGEELARAGARPGVIDETLAPARALIDDPAFWRLGHCSVAMYLAPGFARLYTPPVETPERAVAGDRFEVSPLLPALADGGPFYTLALSGNGWRLLECTRWGQSRVELPGAPADMDEALAGVEPVPSLQHHVGDQPAGARAGVFHGHGVGKDDRNDRIIDYYRQLDHALCARLRPTGRPMVIAATRDRFALYRDISGYPDILPQPVAGAPDVARDDDLRAEAWEIVAPRFTESQRAARARYEEMELAGRGITRLEEALAAAANSRVEVVFAATDRPVWGAAARPAGSNGGDSVAAGSGNGRAGAALAEIHTERRPGDIDLVNEVVALTLLRGGTAFVCPAAELPGAAEGPVKAIPRW